MIIELYSGINHSEYLEINDNKATVVVNGETGIPHEIPEIDKHKVADGKLIFSNSVGVYVLETDNTSISVRCCAKFVTMFDGKTITFADLQAVLKKDHYPVVYNS